jgi:hypothetical protein
MGRFRVQAHEVPCRIRPLDQDSGLRETNVLDGLEADRDVGKSTAQHQLPPDPYFASDSCHNIWRKAIIDEIFPRAPGELPDPPLDFNLVLSMCSKTTGSGWTWSYGSWPDTGLCVVRNNTAVTCRSFSDRSTLSIFAANATRIHASAKWSTADSWDYLAMAWLGVDKRR